MASIRKRGRRWEARIRKRGYETVCETFAVKREAEEWARAVEAEMDTGAYVVDKRALKMTLGEVIDLYLERRVPQLQGHQPRYETLDWRERPLAKRVIGTIAVADVVEWLGNRQNDRIYVYERDQDGRVILDGDGRPVPVAVRRVAPKTVLNEFRRLSAIFTWAKEELGLASLANPCKSVSRGRLPQARARDRRLAAEEVAALRAAAGADPEPLLAPAIDLALETACRRSELVRLHKDDYRPDDRTLWIRETKNGDDREIGLTPRAIEILERLTPGDDGRLLPTSADALTRAFRRCCEAAGIGGRDDFDGLTFHDLRHEATSRYFEGGRLNIAEVAHQTGHRSYQSLKRYTHMRGAKIAEKFAEKKKE